MDTQKSTQRYQVTVIGQEGDQAQIEVNANEPCEVLLRQGLHELYGKPGPDPAAYDLVLSGKVVDPLSQSISAAGIHPDASISILPKSISRGGRRWSTIRR